MTLAELLVVAVMATLWWGPAFIAISDLQKREEGVPRPLVWKWYALLCVPVAGAVLYQRRARVELDAARTNSTLGARARSRATTKHKK